MSITELLNIEYPVLQGVMAKISTAELVAAVSEAGGLGVLSTTSLTSAEVRAEIRLTREMTKKSIAVNLMLHSKNIDQLMKVVIEEKVPIVTISAGSPRIYMAWLKENNIKVLPIVYTVKEAIEMERIGVDAIIAEGTEAGGHIGETTTMALIPQITDQVSLPVIAAGGIADGRGLVSALALGAQAVQMGTRFLTAEECPIPKEVKRILIAAQDTDTIVTGRKRGTGIRSLRNKMLEEYSQLEFTDANEEQLEQLTQGSFERAVLDGDMETGSLMTGQIVGLIQKIEPVQQIIETIMKEAVDVLSNLKL